MDSPQMTLVVLPKEELEALRTTQQAILQQLRDLNSNGSGGIPIRHITAKEFMEAVRIKRTKYDKLVNANKLKVIRKGRKMYLPVSEIERYFSDISIQ